MRNKSHVTGSKMSVTDVGNPVFTGASAKKMASDLLSKYHRGPGDTIESAAYRVQSKYGVDANVIMQGWNRPPRPMLAHRWLPLFQAWVAAGCSKIDAAYEEERARHAGHDTALVRLADLVGGAAQKVGDAKDERTVI